MTLRVRRTAPITVRTITTLVALFALVAQPMYGLVASQVAEAAGTLTVRNGSLQGWTKYGTQNLEFWGAQAPSGKGALKMSTPNGSQYIQLDKNVSPVTAHNFSLSYDTKRLAGVAHAAPSYVLTIDKDGDLSTEDYFWAWYEPVYNNVDGKNYSEWNTWTLNSDVKYWYSGTKPAEAVTYTQTLDSVLVNLPNAKVVGATINMGSPSSSGNAGWSALVDNVKTTDSVYDFEPTLPVATVDSPRAGGVVAVDKRSGILPVTGKFTDDVAPNHISFQLVHKGKSVKTGIVYGSQVNADGKYTYNMPVGTGLESGEYSLFYTATDFHNGIAPRLERKVFIDNTAPEGVINTPAANSTVGVANGKLSVSGTVEENFAMNRIGVQLVKRGVSGHVQYVYANDNKLYGTNPKTWSAEFKDLSLQDGAEYGINLSLVDQDGNVTNNPTHWFMVDSAAPSIAFTDSTPAANEYVGGEEVQLSTIIEDNDIADYRLSIENGDSVELYYTSEPKSGETNTYSWNTISGDKKVVDGSHTIVATTTDKAGNKSTINRSIIVDNTAPSIDLTVTQTSYKSGEDIVANATAQDSGSGVAGIEFAIYGETLDGRKVERTCSIEAETPNAELDAQCARRLPAGNYVVAAIPYDTLGNANLEDDEIAYQTFEVTPQPQVTFPIGGGDDLRTDTRATPVPTLSDSNIGNAASNFAVFTLPGDTATTDDQDDNTAVLGAQAERNNAGPAEIAAAVPTEGGWKIFGLMWYWWLLIIAAVAGAMWLIGARRRSQDDAAL